MAVPLGSSSVGKEDIIGLVKLLGQNYIKCVAYTPTLIVKSHKEIFYIIWIWSYTIPTILLY